ncbi:MAG: hypothetical protein SGPRY_002591 [Prymnesium sp.]
MGRSRAPRALSLDELGGAAGKKVAFIRTDASALLPHAPSNTQLKAGLSSPYEPRWPHVSKEECAEVLRALGERLAGERHNAGFRSLGLTLGLRAVTRALRRAELCGVLLARESQSPLLYAHIPLLAQRQTQQEHGMRPVVRMLPCSSAQLGQLFGLLRVSTVGLQASHFKDSDTVIKLLAKNDGLLFPWLQPKAPTVSAPELLEDPSGRSAIS